MEVGVVGPISTKLPIGQQYPYYTIWEQNNVVYIHIYEVRAIFLLFCYHLDTESESCEIKMSIYQPIYNRKRYPRICENYIHTLQDGRRIMWCFFIFMELELFSYYFVITKTLNWSNRR